VKIGPTSNQKIVTSGQREEVLHGHGIVARIIRFDAQQTGGLQLGHRLIQIHGRLDGSKPIEVHGMGEYRDAASTSNERAGLSGREFGALDVCGTLSTNVA
jgi:hypothetical protein